MNALSVSHPLHWTRRTLSAFAVILAAVAVAITLVVTLADSSGSGTTPGPAVRPPQPAQQVQCRPTLKIGAYC
jgi:hypothetical protein